MTSALQPFGNIRNARR